MSTVNPAQTGTSPGLKVASVAGVPVYLGRSWPFIVLVVVAIFGPQLARARPDLGVTAYGVAVIFAILLLLSVLAHEVAHAVVGQRCGYRVSRIVADLWGGHTAYDSSDSRPGASALVAVVGPLANGVVAILGWLALPHIPPGVPALLVGGVVWTNGFVALFNLLPGLPLDGGFLVDSLVWRLTGSRASGLIAAGWSGRALTVLVIGWAVGLPLARDGRPSLFDLAWAGFIGFFLWTGASNAIRAGRARRVLARVTIGSVWRRATSVPASASAADAFALRSRGLGGAAVVVTDEGGQAVGLVDDEALRGMPGHALATTPVTAVMRSQPPGFLITAVPEDAITDVITTMADFGLDIVAVRRPGGGVEGVVLARDLETALP